MLVFSTIRRYAKSFKNFPSVYLNNLRANFNFDVTLRKTGKTIRVRSPSFLFFLSFNPNIIDYDSKLDILTLDFDNKMVKFEGVSANGDLASVFIKRDYDIEVTNKIVLDIGANIGDSSIFFSLKGAEKVIAVEPIFENFNLLVRNIIQNACEKLIIPLMVGISSNNTPVKIRDFNLIGPSFSINDLIEKDGHELTTVTLTQLIDAYNPEVIKMDCEGCEYTAILELKANNLKRIKIIILEYHNGYQTLLVHLNEIGFDCRIKKDSKMRGILLATLKTN